MTPRGPKPEADSPEAQRDPLAFAENFLIARDRDAWPAIRGYRYQIELIILSWLAIDERQILELEKGEDFDLFTKALEKSDNTADERFLNQIKCRARSLTLRSPEVLAAIACYIEHSRANPNLSLTLRFITNAGVACERPTLFKKSVPALQVWTLLQHGKLDSDEAISARKVIREFLLAQQKPPGLNDATWEAFQSFVESASENDIDNIILHIEWMTNQPEPASIEIDIKRRIIDAGHADSNKSSDAVYEHLLCYVLKILSSPGPKRLTHASLMAQVACPFLPEESKAILDRYGLMIEAVEERVAKHESELKKYAQAIAGLQERMGGLERTEAQVAFAGFQPVLEVPPLTEMASKRRDSVGKIIEELQKNTWFALNGTSGSGKTQLAILITQQSGRCDAWVRLSSLPERQAANNLILQRSLELAGNSVMGPDRQGWYDRLCKSFGKDALIVLDDISKLSPQDPLGENMVLLCRACYRNGVHLLTTSPYALMPSMVDMLGKDVATSIEVPPLTDYEAAEILIGCGAPKEIVRSKMPAVINLCCRQNPTLVVAAAQYLKDKEWKTSADELGDILGGRFARLTNQETLGKLLSTVADPESRWLLERLALVIGRFGDADVKTVAGISPAIERPMDRLLPLMGAWVQWDLADSYLVSPLARSLGPINLTKDLVKGVQHSLGINLLQKGSLNQIDVAYAVSYLCGAEAWDEAGRVFFRALVMMQQVGIPKYDAGLLAFWSEKPLPTGMDLGLRIGIRGLQVALAAEKGSLPDYLVQDLDTLSGLASKNESIPLFIACLNVTLASSGKDAKVACRFYGRAIGLLPFLETQDGISERIEQLRLESLIWFAAWHVSDPEQIILWIETASKMPLWLLKKAASSELAEIGCISITSEIWLREATKDPAFQNWPAVRSTLEGLASRAQEMGLELLWASSVRSILIIQAEYEGRLEAAVELGLKAMAGAKDPRGRFLIEDSIARQYLTKRITDRALEWFLKSLGEPTSAFPLIHMQANVHTSIALDDYDKAASFLEDAVRIGLADDEIPRTEVAKVLGEQCILLGLRGNLPSAFESLDEAVAQLLEDQAADRHWRAAFTVLSHISGYFSSLASFGHPPESTGTGDLYAVPSRGMFLSYDEDGCSGLYSEERKCAVFTHLAQFAEAIGNEERSEHWAFTGMEAARKSGYALGIDVLSLYLVPLMILRNQLSDAQELAVESAAITTAMLIERSRGKEPATNKFDYRELLGPKPGADWDQAERNSVMFGTLPIICKIAADSLSSEEVAAQLAQEVILGTQKLEEAASHKELWKQAISIFRNTFVTHISYGESMALSDALDDQTFGWLRLGANIGISIHPDCPLPRALQIHFNLLSIYHKGLGTLTRGTYNRILVPFVTAYWKRAFEKYRFRFRSPSQVEEELKSALGIEERGKAQRVLKVIAYGLGVPLGDEAREWLRTGSDKTQEPRRVPFP